MDLDDLALVLFEDTSVILKLLYHEKLTKEEIETTIEEIKNKERCDDFICFLKHNFDEKMFASNYEFFEIVLCNSSLYYFHKTINDSLIYRIPIEYVDLMKNCTQIFPNIEKVVLFALYPHPFARLKKFLTYWWTSYFWHDRVEEELFALVHYKNVSNEYKETYDLLYNMIKQEKIKNQNQFYLLIDNKIAFTDTQEIEKSNKKLKKNRVKIHSCVKRGRDNDFDEDVRDLKKNKIEILCNELESLNV